MLAEQERKEKQQQDKIAELEELKKKMELEEANRPKAIIKEVWKPLVPISPSGLIMDMKIIPIEQEPFKLEE